MHALIINGSPRVKKYSNTDKILGKITEGMIMPYKKILENEENRAK